MGANIGRLQLGIILTMLTLAGCGSNPFRGFYEGIKNRNESLKKPEERATLPHTPSYDEYKKELDRLKQNDTDEAPVTTAH